MLSFVDRLMYLAVLMGVPVIFAMFIAEAGLAIVILAIVVDRISQGFGQARRARKSPRAARAPQTGAGEA